MDFRQLETFVEVAKLKSFSKAADSLYITQPTVTNHIQNLEKEIGTLLINRHGKNITLTDSGSLLYRYAINILNSCEMAKFDLAMYQGKIQGHLQIYSSSVPRNYILPKVIKSFIDKYNEVTFSLTDKDSKKVIQSILDGETDFGIIGAKYPMNSLEYIELLQDKLVLITPNTKDFPWENYSTIDSDILFKEHLILREEGSGTRNLIENVFEESHISMSKLKVRSYVEDTQTLKNLVTLGIGISLTSEKVVHDDVKNGLYKAFYLKNLSFSRNFYFVFHKSRQLSPLSESFKNHLLNHIKEELTVTN